MAPHPKGSTMSRLDRLRSLMAETGTALVALAPGAHLRWLLGFAPHPDERPCLLLIGAGRAAFLMPALNAADARQHTDLPFCEWDDAVGPDAALGAALDLVAPGPGAVAIDEAMRADHALLLLDRLPGRARGFAAATVGTLRMCKDGAELAALAENARIADLAQAALRAAIRDGVTEAELAAAAAAAFTAQGATPTFAIVGTGVNSSYPHHHTGDAVVRPGQPIVCDIGATIGGYHSDITRMACLGAPPADYAAVHAVVEAAVQAALAAIRPGVAIHTIDRAARDTITAAGYGEFFTHRTGHGLGTEVHEPPYATASSDTILREGMVFTIEPGIYLPGRFGVRLEEVVVVTADGARILSNLSRDLFIA